MIINRTLVIVALSAALMACTSQASGTKYLGKWADKTPFPTSLNVRRNDGGLIVDVVYRDFIDGMTKSKTAPAAIKDGLLSIDLGNPLEGPAVFALDDKTGKLVGKGLSLDKAE